MGTTLQEGVKRKAARIAFQKDVFQIAFNPNPKKPRLLQTVQKAVDNLFLRDNAQLSNIDEEERHLRARLRELNHQRSKIMQQNYLHVPTWDDTYPVLCTIELGGPSKTMSFTGGRNADRLNASIQTFSGLDDAMGGNAVRSLLSKLCTIVQGECKEEKLEEDVTPQACMAGLMTSVLQLSCDGVRSCSGCVLVHYKDVPEKLATEEGHSTKTNKTNEVQILFTHLLSWVQLQLMKSIPDCSAYVEDAWLEPPLDGKQPVPLSMIWRTFNKSLIDEVKENNNGHLLPKVRFNTRSVLYCLMPERIEKDHPDPKSKQNAGTVKVQKTADLKLFGLMHHQSKESWFKNQPDPFSESLIRLEPCKKQAKEAVTSISEVPEPACRSRASAKSWPGDLSRVQSRPACVATVASFARGSIQYPSSSMTPQDIQLDAKLFLNEFKGTFKGGVKLQAILTDSQVSCEHKRL